MQRVVAREFEGTATPPALSKAQEVLTLLMASTGEGPEAELWHVTPSALHFFVATLLHIQPTQSVGPGLAETLSICMELKSQASASADAVPPLHEIAVEVITAACAREPLRVLRAALRPALQGSWVAAHAAALMAQDARYADLLGPQLPYVRSTNCMCNLSAVLLAIARHSSMSWCTSCNRWCVHVHSTIDAAVY